MPARRSSINLYVTWLFDVLRDRLKPFWAFASITGRAAVGNCKSAKSFRQTAFFFSFMIGINIWNPLRAQHEIDHNWGHFKYKMEHSEEQPAVMKSSVTLTVSLVSASSPFSSFFFIFSLQLHVCLFVFNTLSIYLVVNSLISSYFIMNNKHIWV